MDENFGGSLGHGADGLDIILFGLFRLTLSVTTHLDAFSHEIALFVEPDHVVIAVKDDFIAS